jgi:hypothetical protein
MASFHMMDRRGGTAGRHSAQTDFQCSKGGPSTFEYESRQDETVARASAYATDMLRTTGGRRAPSCGGSKARSFGYCSTREAEPACCHRRYRWQEAVRRLRSATNGRSDELSGKSRAMCLRAERRSGPGSRGRLRWQSGEGGAIATTIAAMSANANTRIDGTETFLFS